MNSLRTLTLLASVSLFAACSSTPTSGSMGPDPSNLSAQAGTEMQDEAEFVPPPPAPWTLAFQEGAMLLADRVTIEGPAGLLEHFVMRGDDSLFERVTKTTAAGFVQVLRPRNDVFDPAKAHLDRWNLNALYELRAIENPAFTEVKVTAEGNAIWRSTDGETQRGAKLEFLGHIEVPQVDTSVTGTESDNASAVESTAPMPATDNMPNDSKGPSGNEVPSGSN
tara:strand:- start:1267 stop:1935 length:669 start_codon:yes stop_codon:yes gene_type:complete